MKTQHNGRFSHIQCETKDELQQAIKDLEHRYNHKMTYSVNQNTLTITY